MKAKPKYDPIDWNEREWQASPEEMTILERFATQPANYRSRKPSRFIWLYTLGKPKGEILDDLKLSEETLERYFDEWCDGGVPAMTKCSHPELYRDIDI